MHSNQHDKNSIIQVYYNFENKNNFFFRVNEFNSGVRPELFVLGLYQPA